MFSPAHCIPKASSRSPRLCVAVGLEWQYTPLAPKLPARS